MRPGAGVDHLELALRRRRLRDAADSKSVTLLDRRRGVARDVRSGSFRFFHLSSLLLPSLFFHESSLFPPLFPLYLDLERC